MAINTVTMRVIIYLLYERIQEFTTFEQHEHNNNHNNKKYIFFGEMHKNGISSDGNTLCVEDGPQ